MSAESVDSVHGARRTPPQQPDEETVDDLRAAVAALQVQLTRARRERDAAIRTADEAAARLDRVYRTRTWRVGRAVLWLPRQVVVRARRSPRARKVLGRLRRRRVGPVPVFGPSPQRLVERGEVRAAYEQALERRSFSGTAKRNVAMAVSTRRLGDGRGDLYTAIGLGRQLEPLGHEVIYLDPGAWYDVPADTDVFVALIAERDAMVDPLALPADCLKIAWVRNLTERWAASPTLAFYDGVLCSSSASQRLVARVYQGPIDILRIGVDEQLFGHPAATDRVAVVSTVNSWSRERELHRALVAAGVDFPLALYGQRRGLPAELHDYAPGPVSFFSLPSAYEQATLVLDDQQEENTRFGAVNSRIFESLASGALPITNTPAGLVEAGLRDVPTYSSPEDLRVLVQRYLEEDATRRALVARLQDTVLRRHTYRVRAAELDSFLTRVLDRTTDKRPAIIGFLPDYRHTNPYQRLLYAQAPRHHMAAVPADDPVAMADSPALSGRQMVVHIHWTATILGPASSRRDAETRCDRFLADLEELHERGVKIVWTVHNVLPHECTYPDIERRLRQGLANRADLLHVMCERTSELTSGTFTLERSKVMVIDHPSYVDVYPNMVDPRQARLELGLDVAHTVLLFLGGIRPYRGLEPLLDAFEEASREQSDLRLIVAGRPGRFHGVEELRRRCEAHPAVIPYFEPVPDAELQVYLNASDVVVLPHQRVLNSGALLLAWSFGRPVIASRKGCLIDQVTHRLGRLVNGHDEWVRALRESSTLRSDDVRRECFERAAAVPYTAVSDELLRAVGALIAPVSAREAT